MFFTYYTLYKFYNKEPEMFFIFIEENKKKLNIIFIYLYIISIPIYIIAFNENSKNELSIELKQNVIFLI